jgi:hypothetical protein
MKIDWGIVAVSLLVAVPVLAVFALSFWSNRKDKQRGTRFLGIQMDICILIIGLLLLLALIGWVRKTFFG